MAAWTAICGGLDRNLRRLGRLYSMSVIVNLLYNYIHHTPNNTRKKQIYIRKEGGEFSAIYNALFEILPLSTDYCTDYSLHRSCASVFRSTVEL